MIISKLENELQNVEFTPRESATLLVYQFMAYLTTNINIISSRWRELQGLLMQLMHAFKGVATVMLPALF